ncbi:DUF6509 family protein (plasmid) [Cytobacillus spongiae]|uniref:DUF6509 family protein n=1 Tax=Cytobacillus spongiae TaxID=2901381 RepID=UPI00145D93BA|nr:DUF6509 family protein [Cytobacillus spongiae]MCA1062830.1 DUF6509 family protein [Rossellomorea aquimaris]NMH70163.1 pullulanase [Bacillus sp. RO3]UII58440.1 DUF6509 family protein [Cytobacillus spongiae]WJV28528.1 DUF6509 family protein [Rossellomorea sp. AcN35-11]
MNITRHTAEELKDPTGILSGERYEVILDIEVPEDDELYSEQGIYIKAIFVRDESGSRIVQSTIVERNTEAYLDFELEEDEESLLLSYCMENIR